MTQQLLNALVDYGVIALIPILVLGAIGVPFPGSLLLVAAGAFTTGGITALIPLFISALLSTIVGNIAGYWLGKRGGTAVLDRWGPRLRIDQETIARSERLFHRHGGISVALSRFPFTPLSSVINVLAGTAGYAWRPFLLSNLLGVSIWAAVYLGLGYIFAASWDQIAEMAGGATQILTLGLISIFLAVFLYRAVRRNTHSAGDQPESESIADPAPCPR